MRVVSCLSPFGFSFDEARTLGTNFENKNILTERTTSIPLGFSGPIENWRTRFLFDYDVFPLHIMQFHAEWLTARRPMTVGDIIVQRAVFPPVGLGVCLQFAVRVCYLIQDERRLGFAYETLHGHAESGISEFYFEEDLAGALHFTIHTFSHPAHWSTRALAHVFTNRYQAWCTRRALEHVRDRFHEVNAGTTNNEGATDNADGRPQNS